MIIYTIEMTVSDRDGKMGSLTKQFQAWTSWEALQQCINEVKLIGFPVVHDIQINKHLR